METRQSTQRQTENTKKNKDKESFFNIQTLDDLISFALKYPDEYPDNEDLGKLFSILPYLHELNQLVGLKELKEQLIKQIVFYIQGLNTDEMLHTALLGPPGVGKTTVARLIGKIFTKLGFLKKGKFRSVSRDDLIGQYLGETAIKTQYELEMSLGGVLFIDEAYSLGNSGSGDSYSKECIDTINKFLSENTRNFMCIIAGYEEQIEDCFFARNQGLARRFPWKYVLKPYDHNELVDIVYNQMEEGKWKVKFKDSKEHLKNIIRTNKELFEYNGGDTHNFINSCKMCHAKRVFGAPKNWKRKLSKIDFENGIEMFRKNKKKKDEVPFGMYT